eukprot:NODE_4063_length_714_cov_377.925645.p3 GENE.NODE_4063_length_714_cov_377.925645~~NODE_4063_length_714_cov_377.925645.p3  ORF type:complete len:155 (+),score=33.57 NODE_4063_length_714_cov_377.925645:3-467(+)
MGVMLKPQSPGTQRVMEVGPPNLIGWPPSAAGIKELFGKYGAEGRSSMHGYFDLISDSTFATCNSVSMALGLYALQPERRWLCVVALSSGLCNVAENFCIVRLADTYPDLDPMAVVWGPRLAQGKLVGVVVSLLAIVASGFLQWRGGDKGGKAA